MESQEITISISSAEDYKTNWAKMSQAKQLEAFQLGIARVRYMFNIPLFGEGTSYEGHGTITPTIKHRDQPDGYRQPNIYAYPPIPVNLLSEEVRAVMCWVLGEELPVEYTNGIPRIKAIIDAMGGLTLLEAVDPPAEQPGMEGFIEGNEPQDIEPL